MKKKKISVIDTKQLLTDTQFLGHSVTFYNEDLKFAK